VEEIDATYDEECAGASGINVMEIPAPGSDEETEEGGNYYIFFFLLLHNKL
jgi:hypothetical protein